MKIELRIAGLCLLGLLAVGCGKTDPLEAPTSPRGTISTSQASTFTSGGGKVSTSASTASNDGGGSQMQGLNSSSPVLTRGLLRAAGLIDARVASQLDEQIAREAGRATRGTCTTTITPTTPVDADSDKVHASKVTDVVCALSESNITYNSTFKVNETDSNDADPNAAVSVELPLSEYSFNFASVITGKGQLAGKSTMTTDATTKKRTWSFNWGQVGEWEVTGENGKQSIDYATGIYLNGSRLPNSAAAPFGNGTLDFTGFYKVKAKVGTQTLDIVLSLTGTTLALVTTTGTGGCPGASEDSPKPLSGTISMKDASENTLLGTYTNCSLGWKFNGATVTR